MVANWPFWLIGWFVGWLINWKCYYLGEQPNSECSAKMSSIHVSDLSAQIQQKRLLLRGNHFHSDHPRLAVLSSTGCVKKYSRKHFWQYFPNDWEILNTILHAYIVFISMQNYKMLFNYL